MNDQLADRFLIGGDPADLAEVASGLVADPQVAEVEVHGPAAAPTLVVAALPATVADELRTRFGGRLVVERDAQLDPPLPAPAPPPFIDPMPGPAGGGDAPAGPC
jgi:hypothetical protein